MGEMTYGQDEDRKNHERMQALIDQLLSKIKSYKKQIEEAEEIAALNLAKYRNAHAQLSDAEERADLNEQALKRLRPVANLLVLFRKFWGDEKILCKWMIPTGSQNGEILHAIDSQQFNIIL